MGQHIELLHARFLQSTGISIDSRTVQPGNLFFGLSGGNQNGSQYSLKALKSGAVAAVVDDPAFAVNDQIILVKDCLKALQELASYHRDQFKGKVIGITGSNGKTTTKELVNAVLKKQFEVLATKGNLNNHIGVPLTLLQLTDNIEIAIIEMGANHVGEIAALCEIAKPMVGIITNIGYAHTEGFGGIEGVLRGKSELFDFLRKTGGIPFINQQDERLEHMSKRFEQAILYPGRNIALSNSLEFLEVRLGDKYVKTNLTGAYNYPNVAAAVSIGRHFGVSEFQIIKALEGYVPENHRSQLIKRNTNTLIVDAYNANPDSMRVALQNLAKFPGKKLAILGDMNELAESDEEHRTLGKIINKLGIQEVILVGQKIKPALEFLPDARHFDSTAALCASIQSASIQNTVILLKASRSIKLEEVLNKI